MRLGLIARCEIARGISIQSKGFYDNMPVDEVLLVRMPKPDCAEAPDWYAWQHTTQVTYDPKHHQLDEATVRAWLATVDVVFTVETPNDWRMPTWCREQGVRLVIQGNPEFVRHGRPGFEDLPHPDLWAWPTSWRTDTLPAGQMLPVPMSQDVPVWRTDVDGPLRLLHVVGKRAYHDRNGTDILVNALRRTTRAMEVTIVGLDGSLPKVEHRNQRLKVTYQPDGVTDRWDMYRNQDLLVLPRRYGGLCLPALEAGAAGLGVLMPDCSPNQELAALTIPVRRTEPITVAAGIIQAAVVNPLDLANLLDHLATDPAEVRRIKDRQDRMVRTWPDLRYHYMKALGFAS